MQREPRDDGGHNKGKQGCSHRDHHPAVFAQIANLDIAKSNPECLVAESRGTVNYNETKNEHVTTYGEDDNVDQDDEEADVEVAVKDVADRIAVRIGLRHHLV